MSLDRNAAGRALTLFAGLVCMSVILCGCDLTHMIFGSSLDDVVAKIDAARSSIEAESGAWRTELDKLSTDLKQLEGRVAGDVQNEVTNAANQVSALVKDAVAMTDQAVESRIAQAGTEARCEFNFVKRSVSDELQYLVDDLKFWEKNHKRLNMPPSHGTCWIDPGAVSMYRNEDGRWIAETANMEGSRPIINFYGYNFRSDALPVVDLRSADGSNLIQAGAIKPTYRTNYLISIDLTPGLAAMPANLELVLNWPDDPKHADSSTISLLRTSEAALTLTTHSFTPSHPTATKDSVILEVTVKNTGMQRSAPGGFDVQWVPEPGTVNPPLPIHHSALAPGASSEPIRFPAYTFQNSGDIVSNVYIQQAGVSEPYPISVAQPAHVPASERDYASFPKTDKRAGNSFGGFGEDVVYGGPCASGYVRSDRWLDVPTPDKKTDYATASITWADDDPHDCRVLVHYSIEATGDPFRQNSIDVSIFIKERGE